MKNNFLSHLMSGFLLQISILMMCIAVIPSVSAQSLEVRGFQLAPNDLSASGGAPGARRSVDDGELAALVKVRVNVEGFEFDGGGLGLPADPDFSHPGEVWVYLRRGARKLTIRHNRFGTLTYNFDMPIESARTYIMYLDPGVGAYYNIVTDGAGGTVYLDGDSIGQSPIYNEYINFGSHTISAIADRWEGSLNVDLKKESAALNQAGASSEPRSETLTVKMLDQSEFFGPVTVSADPDAQIYFDGELKGYGSWSADLRQGSYSVEARKPDFDSESVTFTVKPKVANHVNIPSLKPHQGFVQVYTRPLNVEVRANGRAVDASAPIQLPVGLNHLEFSRKGYDTETREVTVRHNVTARDTVNLIRTQYLKSQGFYFGAAYNVAEFSGVTGTLGMVYRNVDAQIAYTFGINKKGVVNYYDPDDYTFLSQTRYAQNRLSVKLGYQIVLGTNLGFTPQLGFAAKSLKGKSTEGTELPGDGASCTCFTLGGKLIYTPMKQVGVFAAPQYDVVASQSAIYETIAKEGNFSAGGFVCDLGVVLIF